MKVAAILLAAGRGRRMAGPKHLLPVEGQPMLARVAQALRASTADSIVVVLRPGDEPGLRAAATLELEAILAESAVEGRAASVRAGVRGCPPDHALLFALADQPWLEAADFDRLIAAARSDGIVQACYGGEPGSPVLFGPAYRSELLALTGGEGGRVVVARHAAQVTRIPLDPARGRDVDRPADLR
jgi:CTP:molybdopterin cytidylyltransferase MocA